MARAKGFRSNQNYILICTDGIKYHGFTRGYLFSNFKENTELSAPCVGVSIDVILFPINFSIFETSILSI